MALAVLLIGAPSSAGKEDLGRVKELYRTGSQHFELGEYAPALDDFKEAYRVRPDPVFLYNIAQCHRFLGNHAEAVRLYKNYLNQSPMAPNRKDVLAHIVTEEAAAIDSQRKAEQNVAEAGRREVELRAAQPAPLPPPAPWYHDTLGWVFAVGGFALVGAGAGLLGFGLSLKVTMVQARTTQVAYEATGGVLAGVGVAALIGGIVKLAVYDKPEKVAFGLFPLDNGGMLSIAGGF